jgi:protein involved in polysaccharide export with SLBB domain
MDSGDVLIKKGKLKFFKGMTVQDAINASGIKGKRLAPKVRLTTILTKDGLPKTTYISLKDCPKIKLNAYDEIEVYNYYIKNHLKPVSIKGEVNKPITVYYEKGMNLASLIERAGGLKDTAFTKNVEIVRYKLNKNQERERKVLKLPIKNNNFSEIKLLPYDEVVIFKIPKWNERKTVTLQGEVKFPGTYVIEDGDKLLDVIKRAGGFTKNAFIEGAVFTRESVRQRQMREYKSSLMRIKKQLAIYNAMPANAADNTIINQNSLDSLNQILQEAEKYTPIGRISLNLDKDFECFAQSPYNITLKNNDKLIVPSSIDTVTVFGEVFNPTSFVYNEIYTVEDYIKLASGYTRAADKDSVYIIHADGTSEPINNGWFGNEIRVQKGDTIVVPLYIKEYNKLKVADSVAKILASFALTVASLNSLGVF